MKEMDKKIKEWVQSVRFQVPDEAEEKFFQNIEKVGSPDCQKKQKWLWMKPRWVIATATTGLALIVLSVFITLFNHNSGQGVVIRQTMGNGREEKIIIHSITVEDKPAKTICYQSKNKDRLIIWTQRAI